MMAPWPQCWGGFVENEDWQFGLEMSRAKERVGFPREVIPSCTEIRCDPSIVSL